MSLSRSVSNHSMRLARLFSVILSSISALASHDKSCFNHRVQIGLFSVSVRPPRVLVCTFSPSICHIYYLHFRVAIGLPFILQSYPCKQPHVISVRQIRDFPPTSFRFHLAVDKLCPSHYRADQGLLPIRYRRPSGAQIKRNHPKMDGFLVCIKKLI